MFIKEYPNSLTDKFCKSLIDKFEEDDRKYSGVTASGEDQNKKKSTDLKISGLSGYENEDKILYDCLSHYFQLYAEEVMVICEPLMVDCKDAGYQVQRTKPGEYYGWHNDFMIQHDFAYVRMVTYIWYLNTIKSGGETEFITGEKIKPEQGKLLLFPATWDMAHRGNPPESETKYIATGWIYSKAVSF